MDIDIFFEQPGIHWNDFIATPGTLGAELDIFIGEFPKWRNSKIALFGIVAEGDEDDMRRQRAGINLIREELYKLENHHPDIEVSDLGNLRPGVSLEESHLRVTEVCNALLAEGVLPVVMNGSSDNVIGQFAAVSNQAGGAHLVCVDARFDRKSPYLKPDASNYLSVIFEQQGKLLSQFTLLAYQTYFVKQDYLVKIHRSFFNHTRVGALKENIVSAEPFFRDAQLAVFDLSAIRLSDAPGQLYGSPFGLLSEEACQLAWYAGISPQIKSVGFFEYFSDNDINNQTAKLISTMIWFVIEGVYSRRTIPEFESSQFRRIKVPMDNDEDIVFFHLKSEDIWWMEVPISLSNSGSVIRVPCSKNDFITATEGEIPDLWINTVSRYNHKALEQ